VERLRRQGPRHSRTALLYRRDLPVSRPPEPFRPPSCPPPVVLEEAVPGAERHVPGWGRVYEVVTRPAELDGGLRELCEHFAAALQRGDTELRRQMAMRCGVGQVAPGELLFVDLETTGLGSTPLFLVGTMQWEGGELVVRQYLARDYSEEAAAIALAAEAMCSKNMLVSFNGKSFDLPYLRMRAAVNAVPLDMEPLHFDLLHPCRSVWRKGLPDCRLKTLESLVCGRQRYGDIPSDQIPAAYHAYVRTRNAALMVEILRHNARDLVTMAELMVRLAAEPC